MKYLSFRHDGTESFGAVVNDGVVDLKPRLSAAFARLRDALEPENLARLAGAADGAEPDYGLDEIDFLPPIPDPGKILCIGINYQTHRQETGRPKYDHPTVFTRFADTLVGHKDAIIRPKVSDKLDYEGELAVIIGRPGRHIAEQDAFAHVAGYACFNEGSVRDWQRHTLQFTPGKNFAHTGGFGPWLVTADEIADLDGAAITTRLNGTVMQNAVLGDMIFPIPALIHYISTFTPLSAGDVICTGTPGGVGVKREPPVFMKPGDLAEVEIAGVGTLVNTIADEA